MTLTGEEGHLAHYEWNEEYQDFTNRFEQWIEIQDLKLNTNQDLYDALHDWLGVTKKGKLLPTQTQMDFFTEYYNVESFSVPEYMRDVYAKEEEIGITYQYKSGTFFNSGTNEVRFFSIKRKKYEVYEGELKTFFIRDRVGKYREIEVIRDTKSKKILAWHRDITNERYLGSQT